MNRIVLLALLALMLAAPGCSSKGISPALPDRETILPESLVSELAGVPMELAYDRLNAEDGFACWAWQEAEGLPRLLVVELRFPPADCDGLYAKACEGADGLATIVGEACYDGRAAHLRVGALYVRISALGFSDEAGAIQRVARMLSETVKTNN